MITLFTEGPLDDAVLARIVREHTSLEIGARVYGKGRAYIFQKTRSLNVSGQSIPIIALADLDRQPPTPCAERLNWLNGAPLSSYFLLRFAVLEVESWLLADHASISQFLAVPPALIPRNVETLDDPKRVLINLARRSRNRSIREALVPDERTRATVGPTYNHELMKFVAQSWKPTAAAEECESLRRAIVRIAQLGKMWEARRGD